MSTIDIRNYNKEEVTKVIISEADNDYYNVTGISRDPKFSAGIVVLHHTDKRTLQISDKEHAENIIKALEYAIANEWFKK